MKRQSTFTISVALLILSSLLLSSCSSSATSNTPVSSAKQAPYPASANTNSSMDTYAQEEGANGERYAAIEENPFLETARAPLSTFSIDVDTASYANVRRMLNSGTRPPKDAVRIEELVNYFEYNYPQPTGNVPFSVNTEVAAAPWNPKHKLVQIGLQGKNASLDNQPASNLVFLVDVSGSMNDPNKLPLLKESMRILVNQLTAKDRIAIVAYAGASGLVLPSTSVSNKGEIFSALQNLSAGGSTNGGAGIQLAYKVASENHIQGGNNRVVLATDGDFNVGLSSDDALVSMIEEKRKSGVFLSVLGFGAGNLNDSMMEKLANKGNGNYSYIDTAAEARKALGSQVAGTLYTIAKDVKIQVEFNPAKVAGYRLIGYENRLLADRDFEDDKKDAGEIGAGHSVTALYEIVPAGQKVDNGGIELKYSKLEPSGEKFGNELMTVKLRYKEPEGTDSKLLTTGVMDSDTAIAQATENMRFASAVAQFGMLLRDSRYKGNATYSAVTELASGASGSDLKNYRSEFLELVRKAKDMTD